MHFFESNAKKQREMLLEATPHVEAVMEFLEELDKVQHGNDKIKEMRAAQAKSLRAAAASTANPDNLELKAAAELAKAEAMEARNNAEDEGVKNNFKVIRYALNEVLKTHYDTAVKIIAIFHGETVERLEEECSIFDLAKKALEIVAQEDVYVFFPQLKRLKLLEQLGISPK